MSKEQWYDRPIKMPSTIVPGGAKAKSNYQLTTLGQKKAESFNLTGRKSEVIMALESNSPCTISEISNITKISPINVKQIINTLLRDGWIRKVTGDD